MPEPRGGREKGEKTAKFFARARAPVGRGKKTDRPGAQSGGVPEGPPPARPRFELPVNVSSRGMRGLKGSQLCVGPATSGLRCSTPYSPPALYASGMQAACRAAHWAFKRSLFERVGRADSSHSAPTRGAAARPRAPESTSSPSLGTFQIPAPPGWEGRGAVRVSLPFASAPHLRRSPPLTQARIRS